MQQRRSFTNPWVLAVLVVVLLIPIASVVYQNVSLTAAAPGLPTATQKVLYMSSAALIAGQRAQLAGFEWSFDCKPGGPGEGARLSFTLNHQGKALSESITSSKVTDCKDPSTFELLVKEAGDFASKLAKKAGELWKDLSEPLGREVEATIRKSVVR